MDWRDMPPLAALRAFAAFAETGDVVSAGAALNVTHAAISQHLRALERHLGVALLDRSGRALTLTGEGEQLAQALTVGFGAIGSVVQELTGRDAARPVHLSVTPSFAANWLMPRLPEFRMAHPDIDLMIDPSAKLVELTPGGIDIALRFGAGGWAGLDSELLIATPMVVIAAPGMLAGRTIRDPEELTDLPWLEELGSSEASNWLQGRGVARGLVGRRVQMPGNLVLEAVRAGQGVAVSTRLFVEADVAAGRVTILFEDPDTGAGYHLVTRPGVLRAPARKVAAWLRRMAREDQMMARTPESASRSE